MEINWDNNVYNLEWVTPKVNVQRAWDNGLCNSRLGDEHTNTKYSNSIIVQALNMMVHERVSILQVSRKLDIPVKYLYRVVDGSRRKSLLIESGLIIEACPWIYEHDNLRIFRSNKIKTTIKKFNDYPSGVEIHQQEYGSS